MKLFLQKTCLLLLAVSVCSYAQELDPLEQSRELIRAHHSNEAAALLQPYVAAHPESAEAHYLLGYTLYQLQNPTQSLAQYTLGAKLREPTNDDLLAVSADYILLKGYADAVKWLTLLTQRDPDNRLAWYYLGRALYSEGQYDQAKDKFERVLVMSPHDVPAETSLGLIDEARGDENHALVAYAEAIQWQNSSPQQDQQPYLRSGVLLNKQGHPQPALVFLLQAQQHGENNPLLHQELGRVYEELGRHKEAQVQVEKAIALEPAAAPLHFLLGRIYREEGMSDKANEQFALTSKLMGSKSSPETLNFDLQER